MDSDSSFQVTYSTWDRLIHRLAFSTPFIQLTAADIERALFAAQYGSVKTGPAIFVTSLPRAGTTVLLEALSRFPSLATHTYRDMPFVLSPILWSRVTGHFRTASHVRERAHADGVQVGYDSPEAFEEIFWRTFWPEKYGDGRIEPWTAEDGKSDATVFFADHMKKIIALRCPERQPDGRYVSKNNGNIARLDLIGCMVPDATILVPVRHPMDHAASLLRQHRHFAKLQSADAFIGRYMADIGHYEFGSLHRPVAFPGLDAMIAGRDASTLEYWIGYWIVAFEHVLARRDAVVVVSYEELCANPIGMLSGLCARLDLTDRDALHAAASLFKPLPERSSRSDVAVDPALRDRAEHVYASLLALSAAPHLI